MNIIIMKIMIRDIEKDIILKSSFFKPIIDLIQVKYTFY